MSAITIVTLTDDKYQGKIKRLLETLDRYTSPAVGEFAYCGCVGSPATPRLRAGLTDVQFFDVPAVWLRGELGNPGNGCIQHGSFLPYLPRPAQDGELVEWDDTVICIDGDIRMQRVFSLGEHYALTDWPHGVIGIGPNAGPDDTLEDEAQRIRPLTGPAERAALWGGGPAPLCGNAGVLVARRSTWYRFWAEYLRLWTIVPPHFGHIAAQQWTINLAIEQSFERFILPQSFHTHGHYGMPADVAGWASGPHDRDTVTTYQGEPVLFAHKCW